MIGVSVCKPKNQRALLTENKGFYVVKAENCGTLSLVVAFSFLIAPLFTFQYLNAVQIKHYNLKQAKRGCNMAKNRSVDYIPGKADRSLLSFMRLKPYAGLRLLKETGHIIIE